MSIRPKTIRLGGFLVLCYNKNMGISDAIIIAVITASVNIFVALIQNRTKGVERERREASRNQYVDDVIDKFDERLDNIEHKLDEHNHYAKKFEEVNIRLAQMQKDIEHNSKQ